MLTDLFPHFLPTLIRIVVPSTQSFAEQLILIRPEKVFPLPRFLALRTI